MSAPNAKEFDNSINRLLLKLRKEKTDFVSYWTLKESHIYYSLKKFGFLVRRKKFCFVMRNEKENISFPKDFHNVNLWNFSHGDSDEI